MWQFVFNRALLMFAQVTTGAAPAMPGAAPATGAPAAPPAMPVPPGAAAQTQTAGSVFSQSIGHTLLILVYFVVCLALVIAVLLQTTKNEGLTGIIGGSTQSVFHGKKGIEERLQEWTNYLAVSFLALSILITFFAFKVK